MRKFYCQDCGTEVPLEVDICPKCKKHFGSVLCPKCNFSGNANNFYDGCPKCGYLKAKNKSKKSYFTLKLFISLFSLLTIILILLINLF